MKLVPQKVSRTVHRKVLVAKKNSPHIFFVGGLVGTIASTVLACRATLKLEKVVDEVKLDLYDTKQKFQETANTEQEKSKELALVYVKSAVKVGRLYAPAIIIGGASVAALTGSHVQLARRNAAITAAFAGLSAAFDEYRARVREEIGEDAEFEIYRGISDEKVEGSKELEKVIDPNALSPYARCFDEGSSNFLKDVEHNRTFIRGQQQYMNHKLRSCGHVFLNEVYDALGFERTSAGAVVGWLYEKGTGDDYIDFGMFEAVNNRFMMGIERCAWLDFNVDGVIYNMI